MKQVKEYLSNFGLSETETDLYLTLLKIGPSTIMNLARESGIKRSTTHNNIEELINKGLVSQTSRGERRMVVAEKPEKLSILLEQKKWELDKHESELPLIVNEINTIIPEISKTTSVEVKYYKGKKDVQNIYNEVLKAKELRAYVNAKEVAKVFVNNMNNFIKTHNERKDMEIWEIMNKSDEVQDYAKQMGQGRYHYKFIPETLNLSVIDYMIFDGKVAIVTIKENASGLIFYNEDYYNNAKAIFDFVWQMIPEL